MPEILEDAQLHTALKTMEPIRLCDRRADAECYVVRAGHEWGYFFLHEPSGSFSAITSFGNFAYIWSAIGKRSLKEFLRELEYGYFFGKVAPCGRGYEWDKDDSVKRIKEIIRDRRKQCAIGKDLARDAYNAIECIDTDTGGTPAEEGVFAARVYDDADLYEVLGGDFDGLRTTRRDPQCVGFWEKLWPVFIEGTRS